MSNFKQTSPYLSGHKLCMSFGAQTLFDSLSLTVHPGERWGIVGPNGAGKSTLLKCLTGKLNADSGTISLRSGLRLAIVSQKFEFDPSKTVRSVLAEALPVEFQTAKKIKQIQDKIDELTIAAEKNTELYEDPSWFESLSQQQEQLEAYSGIGEENILQSALQRGGLEEHQHKTLLQLSGGLQKRVQLLAALLGNPQLVFLDEPTNHLDVNTVEWLEEFLLGIVEEGTGFLGFRNQEVEPFAFVIVSHDRALLDTLVNRILEIEAGESRTFSGNFEAYSEQKLQLLEQATKQRERLVNLYKRELSWLRRGAAARTTKQTARIQRAQRLETTVFSSISKSQNKVTAKIELTAEISSVKRNSEDVLIECQETLGEQQLVVLEDVAITYPQQSSYICYDLNLVLKPGNRIALVGPNGCGKTTLLKAIRGEVLPTKGQIKRHELLRLAYFDQHREELLVTDTVLKTLCPEGEYVYFGKKYLHVMSYLERFLFRRADADRKISALSGGEQARLLLAKLMLEQGNVLVLDEPTNDLDIPTLQTLEQNLCDYSGAVVFTSHDRYFISRVATEVLSFQGIGQISDKNNRILAGVWQRYQDLDQALQMTEQQIDEPATTQKKIDPAIRTKNNSKGLTWAEEKELTALEKKIPELEDAIVTLNLQLNNAYSISQPFAETQKMNVQIADTQKELNLANARWEELFEKKIASRP